MVRNTAVRLAVPVIFAAGCASAGGVRAAPLNAGEAKFYGAPLQVVAPAARQAALAAGLDVDEISQLDSLTWVIIATKGMSTWSYGELVRIVVQDTREGAVAVRVLTKRRLATNVGARGDWSEPIFDLLDQLLVSH